MPAFAWVNPKFEVPKYRQQKAMQLIPVRTAHDAFYNPRLFHTPTPPSTQSRSADLLPGP